MENMQNSGYDDDFWKDVDALKAFLEDEDRQSRTPISGGKQERAGRSAPAEESLQSLDFDLRFESQPGEQEDFRNPYRQEREQPRVSEPRHHGSGADGRRKRRNSRGLILTLYVVIGAELAALAGFGYQWYLWLK